ncbi:MAG: VWA domain-containing protein [Candidatus Methanomethylophilaceae archaeon]|nr:VWA domain-containing protein [Candidatus Methanomethylophilaceae archaeon]
MPEGPLSYPFSAVFGMEAAKDAIRCAICSPGIRTVLIRGPSGSAKTVLCRSVEGLSGRRVVNIPPGADMERLFGSMDMERLLDTGEARLEKGLVAEAEGGLAFVDDVNLMDERTSIALLDAVVTGTIRTERDGISEVSSADVVLIATMNPDEREMSDHLLDRFDICVSVSPAEDSDARREIASRRMRFEDSRADFCESFEEKQSEERKAMEDAARIVPLVSVSDELRLIVSEMCDKVGAEGVRGDIAVINTSIALAALDRRDSVTRSDVERAAAMCLVHRRRYIPEPPPEPPENEEEPPEDREDQKDQEEPPRDEEGSQEEPPEDREDQREQNAEMSLPNIDDMMFEVGRQFRVIDYLGKGKKAVKPSSSRKGRRSEQECAGTSGRQVSARIPDGKTRDIAFGATMRAAALSQKGRERGSMRIVVEDSDIREKVRRARTGCTVMFLVDASGSIGARRRMSAVKGAVLSMLKDSYVKRDKVGLMVFRRSSAEVILPPTRSVEYGYKLLEDIPTGGRTPLSAAMTTASDYMTAYSRSHPGERCYIVLMTDGRSNVPYVEGADPNKEARELAEDLDVPGIQWIVVNTGNGFRMVDSASELASHLGALYFNLEELDADALASSVRAAARL